MIYGYIVTCCECSVSGNIPIFVLSQSGNSSLFKGKQLVSVPLEYDNFIGNDQHMTITK